MLESLFLARLSLDCSGNLDEFPRSCILNARESNLFSPVIIVTLQDLRKKKEKYQHGGSPLEGRKEGRQRRLSLDLHLLRRVSYVTVVA